jgi:hypothetical protein
MNDSEEQNGSPLDEALREHLRGRLDGQLGRSVAAFRREVARKPQSHLGPRMVVWGLCAGASLAASVAIVWATVVHHDQRPKPILATSGDENPTATSAGSPLPLEQTVEYTTVDEGTVVLENQGPARRLRRSVLATFEYYDPQQKANIEITVPQEQTVLVGMQTF